MAAPGSDADVLNAMTVDVEDYFHVSAFDGVLPRSNWDAIESRVVANTERLLDIFAGHRRARHVLRARLGRRALSRTGAADRGGGPRARVTRLRAPPGLRPDAVDVSRGRPPIEERDGAGGRRRGARLSRAELLGDAAVAVGARHPDRRRLYLRRQHLPDPSRSVRHPAVPAARRIGSTGSAGRFSRRRRRPFAGVRSTFRSPAAAISASCPTAGRDGASRASIASEQRPAIFYIHPWEIDPDQPRLSAGLLGRFRHYRNLDKTEARLRADAERFSIRPDDINPSPPGCASRTGGGRRRAAALSMVGNI